jgi:hypothetical protein
MTAAVGAVHPQVAELEGVAEDDVMMGYPSMCQSGCRLLIAYSAYYRLIPKCSLSNPVCPPESPRGPAGIKVAEVDLTRVQLSTQNRIAHTMVTKVTEGL